MLNFYCGGEHIKKTKLLVVGLVFVFLSSSISVSINSAVATEKEKSISLDYNFEKISIEKINVQGKYYDTISLEDTTNFGNPGEPSMPIKGAYILLPYGKSVSSIEIKHGEIKSLGKGYDILPGAKPVPISMVKSIKSPDPKKEIYGSNDLYPGKLYEKVGTYFFRGFKILVLDIYPVQYLPSSGEIRYYSDIQINIQTVDDNKENELYHGLKEDINNVINKVDNPELVGTYPTKNNAFYNRYDLLILTSDSLKDSFMPLKQVNDERGVSTEIKTLKDINIIPSSVTPEDIRDFITSEYQKNGINYVLLGGDKEVVPEKMLYVSGYDEDQSDRFYETVMPSDLYFSCLDGPYNSDGDEYWGETNDGEGGEDVDLMAEVYVGRACVDNPSDVDNFVGKTIDYLNTDYEDSYLKKIIMAGEHLGDHGVASWGGNYLDLLIDECTVDGYTTQGIPSNKYEIEKLYDRDWEGNYWPATELVDRINKNIHIINHDGHSNYVYNMKMHISDVEMFENTKPFFTYSIGCMCGGFDYPNEDCFAEYITTKTPNGAFAAIMNARYGWFWAYSTDGDGTRFKREFWDAVFSEDIPVISKANQDSKEDNLFLLDRSCMRWTYYQLNYFGDPSVAFHIGVPPEKPKKPEGETSIEAGIFYEYKTSSTDTDSEKIFLMWDWGDGEYSNWKGPYNSGEEVTEEHSWEEKGTYSIRVKSKDESGLQSKWSDPLTVSLPKNKIYNRFFYKIKLILEEILTL